MVFNEYIQTSDTTGYFIYTTKVINENGVTFLEVPGGGYSVVYELGENATNLLVYVYDFSVSPFGVNTNVYSIPGVPSSTSDKELEIVLQNAFPNPTKSYINIPYSIDFGANNASIIIYNELGVEVFRKPIAPNSSNYRLNTIQFSKGLYFYNIIADGYKSTSKKIIIQ